MRAYKYLTPLYGEQQRSQELPTQRKDSALGGVNGEAYALPYGGWPEHAALEPVPLREDTPMVRPRDSDHSHPMPNPHPFRHVRPS